MEDFSCDLILAQKLTRLTSQREASAPRHRAVGWHSPTRVVLCGQRWLSDLGRAPWGHEKPAGRRPRAAACGSSAPQKDTTAHALVTWRAPVFSKELLTSVPSSPVATIVSKGAREAPRVLRRRQAERLCSLADGEAVYLLRPGGRQRPESRHVAPGTKDGRREPGKANASVAPRAASQWAPGRSAPPP